MKSRKRVTGQRPLGDSVAQELVSTLERPRPVWMGGPSWHWATSDSALTHSSDHAPAAGKTREVRGGRCRVEVCNQKIRREEDKKAQRRQGKNVGAGEENGSGIQVLVTLEQSGRAPDTQRHPTRQTCSSGRCVWRLRRTDPGRPGKGTRKEEVRGE